LIVLCLGLQGSASTWTFNVVRDLLAASGEPVLGFEATGLAAAESALGGAPAHVVIRAHNVMPGLLALLGAAEARFVLTTRDPRDSVASLCTRLGAHTASWVMEVVRSLASIWTVQQRFGLEASAYESGFHANPEAGPLLAEHLGLSLDAEDARRIAARWSLDRVKALIASPAVRWQPGNRRFRFDPDSGFNEAHIGDGRVGKWVDNLPANEAFLVNRAFQDCCDPHFGLRPGNKVRFSEALFCPPALGDEVDPGKAEALGTCIIRHCYLAVGTWRVAIRGSVPLGNEPRWLNIFVGGQRCHNYMVASSSGEHESERHIETEFTLNQKVHEHMVEVWLQDSTRAALDPGRNCALEMEAAYLQ